MPRLCEILEALEKIAPERYAFPFDKVGLQVGDLQLPVTRAAVSLDRSLGAIHFARAQGCQLLLSHHPLIFNPIGSVDTRSHVGKSVLELASSGIAFVAAHTNWDSARGGVNDVLAQIFLLTEVESFGTSAPAGEQAGRIGRLASALTLSGLVELADSRLETKSWAWGERSRNISRVAIVGGAADDEWRFALDAGADVLLTGEVKQHVAVEATENGLAMIASGHFATEHPGAAELCRRMALDVPDVAWILFAPEQGLHGRPL